MRMDRREFVSNLRRYATPIAIGGGLLSVRLVGQASARQELRQKMTGAAVPILASHAAGEIERIPARGTEEIRQYIHGLSLKTHRFASEICSWPFGQKLRACGSAEEQEQLLMLAFSEHVATDFEVLARIRAIAAEIGAELDRNWSRCCDQLSTTWQTSFQECRASTLGKNPLKDTERLVRSGLEEARAATLKLGEKPALSESILPIGQSALLLMRVVSVAPKIAIPAFLMTALYHAFRYVVVQIQHQQSDYQLAVSDRLATLGNRVGAEFATEIRNRVADLHRLQEQSVWMAVEERTDEAYPWLI